MNDFNHELASSSDDEKPSARADIGIEFGRARCGAQIGIVVPPEESKRLLQLLGYSGTSLSTLVTLMAPILLGLPVMLAIGAAVFVAGFGVAVTLRQ